MPRLLLRQILFSFLFFWSLSISHSSASIQWTEQDEAQRIAMIIEQEKKEFESEMRAQQLKQQRDEARRKYSFKSSSMLDNTKSEMSMKEKEYSDPIIEEENWCYHCTSPIEHLSTAMKKTIREFLKIRRTTYPTEVATPECVSARNFSKLHKQSCKHRYCQTLALVDQNEGASFVLRGCAENFGAIDTKLLDEQPENTCTKLHKVLDIKECICKERKYCYANGKGLVSTGNQFSFPILTIFSILLTQLLIYV